jgi:hypothetical protein
MGSILQMLGREAPLILLVGALFFILAGGGSGLGLPDLFWNGTREGPGHSPHAGRFVTGLSVGLFLGATVFVWLLVESRGTSWSADAFIRQLVQWWWILGGAFVAVWILGAFVRTPLTVGASEEVRWGFLLLAGTAVGMIGFALLAIRLAEHTPLGLRTMVGRFTPAQSSGPELLDFHATASMLFGLAMLAYVLFLCGVRSVYPGAAISVVMILLAEVHGFVAYRFGVGQVVVYLAVGLTYAVLNGVWQRARVPELEDAQRGRATPTHLLSNDSVLNAWKGLQKGNRGLVVVAASGGGIRAALWTGVVLTTLENQWPGFPSTIRLITGASGGMLGAAEWTSTLPGPLRTEAEAGHEGVLESLEFGGLMAVSSGLVLRDLLPPPFRHGYDRGRRLECAWECYSPALKKPLSSLSEGEETGWRPSLVLAPVVVEDGRFLVISNLDLGSLLQSKGPQLPSEKDEIYGIQGYQLFDYLPGTQNTLRLSTAVRLQANFPYVLPSTEVPGPQSGHVRVVDAGYRDDWGVELASSWVISNHDWLRGNTSGVLLIQIRDSPSSERTALPTGERSFLTRGADGLLTPASGLLSSWRHTAASRNDEMVAELTKAMNGDAKNPFMTTVVFELETRGAPLTWSLTSAESDGIRGGLRSSKNQGALKGAIDWGHSH